MQPDSQQTQPHGWASLEERYEVMKEIGDGSFGSVALARVRTAGSHIARRGTLVCASLREHETLDPI
jgi:meiosis induction protein kinase IME2/SME1